MKPFVINGILWKVVRVGSHDARLIDRTGQIKLATTDPHTRTVHLSSQLKGKMLETVLIHEVGHCILISYGLLPFYIQLLKKDTK